MRQQVISHVPHSSTVIPKEFQKEFLVDRENLQKELLKMTDWYTDELFHHGEECTIVHTYSRLICDPERFLEPDAEAMWRRGMGMYYTVTSDLRPLKRSPFTDVASAVSYARALRLYQRHHERLANAVSQQLGEYDCALLIDGHSFAANSLTYEFMSGTRNLRPEICIGTDALHTPLNLKEKTVQYFSDKGFKVALDTPFSGSLVPEPYYDKKDMRVASIMIEINRSLYMDELTGEKKKEFKQIRTLLQEFLEEMDVFLQEQGQGFATNR